MISDICYEQIDEDYWYASYLGVKVIMMKSNGYVNETKLCTDGGKQFKHWLACKHSQEVLAYYNVKLNQPTFPTDVTQNLTLLDPSDGILSDGSPNANLILPMMTISGGIVSNVRGTYIHPRIIHYVAI